MGIRLIKSDWVIGFLSKSRGNKLLYAMKLDNVIEFDEYYHDKKYFKKRPNLDGTWKERCGDNMYYKNKAGSWVQVKTVYHRGMLEKDTRYPMVFVSNKYYYFGHNAIAVPEQFVDLIPKRHGVKCDHDSSLVKLFIDWIERNSKSGIQGMPIDNIERGKVNKKRNKKCSTRCDLVPL